MSSHHASVAAALDDAARKAVAVPQFSGSTPFSIEEAYRIQALSIERRCQRGERRIGIKLGFTSRAKMVQMGVDSLIWGWLTDDMVEEDGGSVQLEKYIHPRAEPEICFLSRRDIDRPLTLLEAVHYIEAVAPAIEIIDSRYEAFRFTLEDVVADNCSSAGLVVGPWSGKRDALANLGVVMRVDGRVAQTGSTAAILGHPLRSLVQASQILATTGTILPAGSLIMAGAATAAEVLARGNHVSAMVSGLGTAAFHAA
ncbi:2-keto-4-pentenoate hydratase [Cupriavidus oxalaticus]|uniref:4-oxalocrotonate decarboxylase n=1 Tax=Cupriavidus oxalaticus TaxID=96344 RepID=A0A976BIY0_9BURK|nr:fumarylacetoacetate hydrolase family protein [Cupriavidus oxalaticus]QRQ85179.1 fumarylacetoacetate hydrolase family protein [Cupriavidus oxalaticus]QRQ90733.1 fumarylacetoacetate hydrolase family protein [Cupriavidus oxalaticus]WQD85260.1 fumarylacetoacetate hydrolase family protein [Cupriavidus oxalaticus]SPC23405.1 4-oxalocrotonate decarboxylase [Cupriavidus oxalaticus]